MGTAKPPPFAPAHPCPRVHLRHGVILHRVMRMRLQTAAAPLSPERAPETLRRVQDHRIELDATHPVSGVLTLHRDPSGILKALKVRKPAVSRQFALSWGHV